MTLVQILTAVVALYGAFLSTANFLNMLRSKRWRASFSFAMGRLETANPTIELHIANSGEGLSLCIREPYLWWREGLDSVRT